MEYYIHLNDIEIIRDKDSVKLYDCEGTNFFSFPVSFTDEQIIVTVMFANKAYDSGYHYGRLVKIDEIKKVLCIKD